MILNAYTCTSILLLLNRHSIKPYYKMTSMLCSIMVTLGICFSIILSVYTCIFISIPVQILLLTTSIINDNVTVQILLLTTSIINDNVTGLQMSLFTKTNIQYTCNCLKKAIIHITSKISINLLFPTLVTVLTQGHYCT